MRPVLSDWVTFIFFVIDIDHKGCCHNLTLVQYVISFEQVLDKKPHGNSRKEEPYF